MFKEIDTGLSAEYSILGDKAYRYVPGITTPWSKPELNDPLLLPRTRIKRKAENKILNRERVLIEHIFGTLKQDFSLLDRRWKYDRMLLPEVLLACCKLENKLTKLRNRWTDNLLSDHRRQLEGFSDNDEPNQLA